MCRWYERSHAKATLVFILAFISRALLDVSSDALQEGRKDLAR